MQRQQRRYPSDLGERILSKSKFSQSRGLERIISPLKAFFSIIIPVLILLSFYQRLHVWGNRRTTPAHRGPTSPASKLAPDIQFETAPTQTVFVFAHVSSICTTASEHISRISSITANRNQRLAIPNYEASIDSDNHADTWCFGKKFRIICYSGKICDISGFTSQIGTSGTRVGTGVTVWTCH